MVINIPPTLKLIVITTYFYPQSGGVANHTYNLYKALLKNFAYEIVIITTHRNITDVKIEYLDGMKVYHLPYRFKLSNTPISFKWIQQIKSILKEEQPDVMLAHSPVPYLADISFYLKGTIPFIFKWHHAGSMRKGVKILDQILSLYESTILKHIIRHSDSIISASDFSKQTFLNKYGKQVVTISPGVDTSRFKYVGMKENGPILFVANLNKAERYKGLDILLQAFKLVLKEIPHAKLKVVGDGDDITRYKNLTSVLSIDSSVHFAGKLQGDALVEAYSNARMLVLPSLFESSPNVILEAMSVGLPVVGSNIGGIPDLITDTQSGFLFSPNDNQALSQFIIRLLSDKNLAASMGKKGHDTVMEKFTWDIKAKETHEIIQKLLHTKSKQKTSN